PIDDAVLARRLFLDVNGLLPTPEQLSVFVNDQRADKRSRLVSQLLADDTAYAEHWLTFWNDLLRNDYTGTGFITGGRKQITRWLYQSLTTNKPYDQMVRELIAPSSESEGFIQGIRWRGDVSASQTNEVQFAQSICQSLLGINMKCASCHDSFIDRWKLSEAYGLAAIYSSKPLMIHRCDKPTGKTAEASWIFPELGNVDPKAPQAERLKQLAALMTHPDNGRLTRTIVNRLWHRLMGRGIVHPTDAMHTEPWDADLLDFLAIDLVDHKYDLKRTISLICNSRHYQSHVAVLKNSSDDKDYVYTGPVAKRMTAEQFVDTVWQLTGSAPTRYDAPVQRGRPTAQDAAAGPLAAKWIWSYATASAASPARETFVVRKRLELPAAPSRAAAVITCDNSYELFVNGQKVAADDNWETVEAVPLVAQLKAGQNEILIVGKNGGEGPNPAGLVFECRIWTAKSEQAIVVASDETWEWTAAKPDGRGRFAKQPADWKPAVPLANPGVWAARVTPDLIANLSNAERSGSMMVRASLVKSDALMRSLGRPNRDQIVTMRPSEMTTLEAIDLANAQTLADAIARGAGKWRAVLEAGADAQSPKAESPKAESPKAESPKSEPTKAPSTKAESSRAASTPAMIRQLYLSALSRAPSDDELAIATEILTSATSGSAPGAPTASAAAAAAIEDLLWSVVMLPEFHLIR
ncbi:MAG TPA: DUF1549 domain-containing protein, partial [Pirellulaceae bacterium]|nr:DUF1549 domain-containing protein [Pirellulaceae bacterium]